MSERKAPEPQHPSRLGKTKSWSPDMHRGDAVWRQRKREARRLNKSFTWHDLDDLKGCLELGFSLDSPDLDPRLCTTFPALEFYRTVTRPASSGSLSRSSSSKTADSDASPPQQNSFRKFFNVADPEMMKIRLKQWAKVVACQVRYSTTTVTTSTTTATTAKQNENADGAEKGET